MKNKFAVLLMAMLLRWGIVHAQIPVEVFVGQERSTLDIMFFKYFKNDQGLNSPWLFFNRNRASIDYRMTGKSYLPQFGFTEAISYNHKKLKGFAPVAVVQVLSTGVLPKAGIQYACIRKELTIFTWCVTELLPEPAFDFFLLCRYTPPLTKKLNLFTQFEAVNAIPTSMDDNFSLTQRTRLGLATRAYQFGMGADFNQTGRNTFAQFDNVGVFLRHEF